jgi:hypothetical protein
MKADQITMGSGLLRHAFELPDIALKILVPRLLDLDDQELLSLSNPMDD